MGAHASLLPYPRGSSPAQVALRERRRAEAERRWAPEAIALFDAMVSDGKGRRLTARALMERFPDAGFTLPIVSDRYKDLGITIRTYTPWSPDEERLLARLINEGLTFAQAAKRVSAFSGVQRSATATSQHAQKMLGLSARETKHRVNASDLARRLDVSRHTLWLTVNTLRIPFNGGGLGRARLFSAGAVSTVEAIFPVFSEPVYDLATAAHVLGVDQVEALRLCTSGALQARRWGIGRGWRITKREVDRYLTPPFWRRDPELPAAIARRVGCEVQTARPLFALARKDGVFAVPAPNKRRVTWPAGQIIGRIVGAHGGLAIVETVHGPVPCQLDDLDPANIADGPWEKYAAITAELAAPRPAIAPKAPKVKEPHPWRRRWAV